MSYDSIAALEYTGYSEREASFLYIVAAHSGYFLRRQFLAFVDRERGAVATHFLRKAVGLGHVRQLACAEGKYIYHLAGKPAYRLLSMAASQNHRVKSPTEIRRRLMALDYILCRVSEERFVDSVDAARILFAGMRVADDAVKRAQEFGQFLPISAKTVDQGLLIRFAYIDEGQRSTAMFSRFLIAHNSLLRSLEQAEIVYVCVSPMYFAAAKEVFEHQTPLRNHLHSTSPLGVEHLIQWLQIHHKFNKQRLSITPAEHQHLLAGERVYCAPVHTGLLASWDNGAMTADKIRKLLKAEQYRVTLKSEFTDHRYPESVSRGPGKTPGYVEASNSLFSNEVPEA